MIFSTDNLQGNIIQSSCRITDGDDGNAADKPENIKQGKVKGTRHDIIVRVALPEHLKTVRPCLFLGFFSLCGCPVSICSRRRYCPCRIERCNILRGLHGFFLFLLCCSGRPGLFFLFSHDSFRFLEDEVRMSPPFSISVFVLSLFCLCLKSIRPVPVRTIPIPEFPVRAFCPGYFPRRITQVPAALL